MDKCIGKKRETVTILLRPLNKRKSHFFDNFLYLLIKYQLVSIPTARQPCQQLPPLSQLSFVVINFTWVT